MNEESAKKALIYVLVAVAIFIVFRPKSQSEKQTTAMPLQKSVNSSGRIQLVMPTGNNVIVKDESRINDSMVCIKAFIDAYNNDESESVLIDLNNEMKDNYGLYLIKTNKDITVYDLNNNEVVVAKI
jgi:hypothetical protein